MSEERPEPVFKVGQIAVMKNSKGDMPFRVKAVEWFDGEWFYGWNSKNMLHTSMVRKVTAEEVGL